MGTIIAGGQVGLGKQQYEEHGIVDYSETFRSIQPDTTEVFGDLLNQEDSLERFVESLALDVRGRLNLGAAGVGKTTCVQALFSALEKLDKGEEITGPYAEQIKAYHKERHSHARGEIIALWNPKDYHKPIIFRGRDANATTSLEDVLAERHDELIKEFHVQGAQLVRDALLREQALSGLATAYRAREHKSGDTRRLDWRTVDKARTGLPVAYAAKTPTALRNYWNKSVRGSILDLARSNPRQQVDVAMRAVLELGKDAMENEQPYRTAWRKKAEQELDEITVAWAESLGNEATTWKTVEPDIATWYGSVAAYLKNEKNREALLSSFWEEGASLISSEQAAVKKGKNKRSTTGELHDYMLRLQTAGKDFAVSDLMRPHRKRGPSGNSLIVRSPTVTNAIELFIDTDAEFGRRMGPDYDSDDDTEPLHRRIELGELAYADIVFLDDGLADMVAEKNIRQALLTYLSEGRISVAENKTQIECKSHCHLFACETSYPFRRQVFEGTDPEYDEGMERRFSIIEWPDFGKHNEKTIASFPRLLKKTTSEVRSVAGQGVYIEPEAMNLLYHNLLSASEPMLLFPLAVGQLSKYLFQPLAARVSGKGRDTVTAKDVREFLDNQRNQVKIMEEMYIKHGVAQHPDPTADRLVGHANGMYAGHGFGGAFHLTAGLTHKLGEITSADKDAGLMDETFDKGVRMTDLWLNSNFGPMRLGLTLTDSEFSQSGGPSSSAVNTYATLSAIGGIPIDQNTYATGTVLDVHGTVGVIGGAFRKTRGSMIYHNERYGGKDVPRMRVLVPRNNVRGFLRETLLDETVANALKDGSLEAVAHHDIWDGFELLSGMPRSQWEPIVRERIKELTHGIAKYDHRLKEQDGRHRNPSRIYR